MEKPTDEQTRQRAHELWEAPASRKGSRIGSGWKPSASSLGRTMPIIPMRNPGPLPSSGPGLRQCPPQAPHTHSDGEPDQRGRALDLDRVPATRLPGRTRPCRRCPSRPRRHQARPLPCPAARLAGPFVACARVHASRSRSRWRRKLPGRRASNRRPRALPSLPQDRRRQSPTRPAQSARYIRKYVPASVQQI